MAKRYIKKDPPINRLEADAVEAIDAEGQTTAPESYGHGAVFVDRSLKED